MLGYNRALIMRGLQRSCEEVNGTGSDVQAAVDEEMAEAATLETMEKPSSVHCTQALRAAHNTVILGPMLGWPLPGSVRRLSPRAMV